MISRVVTVNIAERVLKPQYVYTCKSCVALMTNIQLPHALGTNMSSTILNNFQPNLSNSVKVPVTLH